MTEEYRDMVPPLSDKEGEELIFLQQIFKCKDFNNIIYLALRFMLFVRKMQNEDRTFYIREEALAVGRDFIVRKRLIARADILITNDSIFSEEDIAEINLTKILYGYSNRGIVVVAIRLLIGIVRALLSTARQSRIAVSEARGVLKDEKGVVYTKLFFPSLAPLFVM